MEQDYTLLKLEVLAQIDKRLENLSLQQNKNVMDPDLNDICSPIPSPTINPVHQTPWKLNQSCTKSIKPNFRLTLNPLLLNDLPSSSLIFVANWKRMVFLE